MATSSPGPMDQSCAVLVQLGPQGPALLPSRSPFLRADDMGVLRGTGCSNGSSSTPDSLATLKTTSPVSLVRPAPLGSPCLLRARGGRP